MARQLTKMPCPQRVQNKFHPYKGRSSDSSKINLATCNWPKVINIKLQEDSVCVCVCVCDKVNSFKENPIVSKESKCDLDEYDLRGII